eukprot:scaffold637_cov286-Alexandrium_tamarense.AAC.2
MSEDVSSNHNSCTKCELQLLLRWYDSTVPTDVINGVWVVLERSGVVAEDAYQVRVLSCRWWSVWMCFVWAAGDFVRDRDELVRFFCIFRWKIGLDRVKLIGASLLSWSWWFLPSLWFESTIQMKYCSTMQGIP